MHCQTAVLGGLQSLQNVPKPILELETGLIAIPFVSFLLHNQKPVQWCFWTSVRGGDALAQRGLRCRIYVFTPEHCRQNRLKRVYVRKKHLTHQDQNVRASWFEQSCLEKKLVWKRLADFMVSLFKVLPGVQTSHRWGLQGFWSLTLRCWKPLRPSWAHFQEGAGKWWESRHQPLNILRSFGPPASAWEYEIPYQIYFEEILKCPLFIASWGTFEAHWLPAFGIKLYFLTEEADS